MNMHNLLSSLSARRPIFHSEADFQHALAWQYQLTSQTASIRLEKQIATPGSRIHLDLLIEDQSHHIAIELKYKTKKASLMHCDEQFHLRNHSAQDLGRYDFLKDISRIEHYVKTHPESEGYVVLLTNDPSYWNETKRLAVDTEFRIHTGRTISGELAWRSNASQGTIRNRESNIKINATYEISWHDYSHVEQELFRYTLVHVANK